MLPSTSSCIRLNRSLLLALCGVITAVMLPVTQVSANGPHVGSRQVFSGPAGPYDLRVATAPVVGNMHLNIYVARMGGADPVTDARVQVMGQGPGAGSKIVGPMPAPGTLIGPNWYGVNLPIEEAGEWIFTLTVESSLVEATVDFPVTIQKSGGINWGIVGAAVVVLGIAVWLALSQRRRKGRQPQPRRRGRRGG